MTSSEKEKSSCCLKVKCTFKSVNKYIFCCFATCVVTLSLCAYKDTCCYSSAPRRWCTYNVRGSHKRSRSDGAAGKTEAPQPTGSWAPASRTSSANQRAAWWWAALRRSGHSAQRRAALTSSSSSVVKFFLKRCLKWSPLVFLFFFSRQRTLVTTDTSASPAQSRKDVQSGTWLLGLTEGRQASSRSCRGEGRERVVLEVVLL